MFKLQNPQNLISRLYILEYMREIGAESLYEKSNSQQKRDLFYKFINEKTDKEDVDINWEYCIFEATLPQLELFLKNFLEEIENIETKRASAYKKARRDMLKEKLSIPVDLNLMDIGRKEIEKNRESGFKFN